MGCVSHRLECKKGEVKCPVTVYTSYCADNPRIKSIIDPAAGYRKVLKLCFRSKNNQKI